MHTVDKTHWEAIVYKTGFCKNIPKREGVPRIS